MCILSSQGWQPEEGEREAGLEGEAAGRVLQEAQGGPVRERATAQKRPKPARTATSNQRKAYPLCQEVPRVLIGLHHMETA